MRRWNFIIAVCVLFFCFLSCDMNSGNGLESRVVLESGSAFLSARVFLEGPDGQAVTGALVHIKSPSGQFTLLEFDYSRWCYYSLLGYPESGHYTVTVSSRAGDTAVRVIPYSILTGSPNVTLLQGSDGKNVLSGDKLSLETAATLQWNAVAGATVYRVAVYSSGDSVIRQYVTTATQVLFPDDLLVSAGNYSVGVTAQYISGDPFFMTESFYAVNEKTGTRLYYEVE